MKRNKIRLTESQLRQMVAESVKSVLNEIGDTRRGQYALGQLGGRRLANNDSFGEMETAVHARDNRSNIYHLSSYEDGMQDYLNAHTENKNAKKAQQIISALQKLNFEERGHEINDYSREGEISVSNINVPALADCQAIARKYGVRFEYEESFNLGIFWL